MEKEYLRSCPHCELGLASERTDQGTKFTCGSIINDFTEEWVYASPLCDDISQLRRHFIDFCKKENRECVVIEYTGQDYKVMLGTSILSRGTMEQCIEYCEAAERPFLVEGEKKEYPKICPHCCVGEPANSKANVVHFDCGSIYDVESDECIHFGRLCQEMYEMKREECR